MSDIILVIILVILFIILSSSDTIEVPVEQGKESVCVEKGCYRVASKYEDKIKAAETLATIDTFAKALLSHLKIKYVDQSSSKSQEISFLLNNYRSSSLIENTPTSSKNTSYVENKGEKFAVCLRQRDKIQDMHTLEFVVIHELSHLLTYGYGHEKDFWKNFKFMLTEAKEAKLHVPYNYGDNNKMYCGLNIYYNPYFDKKIRL